ncbi:MAG: hypothetical protein QOJ98_743 [Acidobacteriota bacterium]|jgi:hypothetical protein|nr:hypothetical protein [Acidobacteriota bacterium]
MASSQPQPIASLPFRFATAGVVRVLGRDLAAALELPFDERLAPY